jgi:hypothetical protein
MVLLTRVFGARLVALLAPIGLSACLRFVDTPDPWPCTVDDDCQDGRVCMRRHGAGECRNADYCEYDWDCADVSACVANACTLVECTLESEAICAPYVCKGSACLSSCTSSSGCDSQHECKLEKCVLR